MAEESGRIISADRRFSPFVRFSLVLAALTAWALATGYYKVFSVFAAYDDEGYLMLTVRNFLRGSVLYDEVYTQYGPSYYLFKWFLNSLFGIPLTHDATRLTTLLLWVLMAFGCSLFTYRLTRSAFASAAAYALSFLILTRTVYEAGHPQEWCGVLTVGMILLLTGKTRGRGFEWRLALFGAALAALFLTKINLGIFTGLAAAFAFTALTVRRRGQRILLIGISLAAISLPFILLKKFLFIGWLNLSAAVAVALIAASIIFLQSKNKVIFSFRHYAITAVSFVLTAAVIVLIFLFQGTTFEALLNGVFFQNLSFGEKFFIPPTLPFWTIWWTIFALAAATLCIFFRNRLSFLNPLALALVKAAFGFFAVLLPFALYVWLPESAWLIGLATPFLWIFLIGNNGEKSEESERAILPRFFLVPAAALQTLQIFPIAGTQVAYGSLLITVIAVLCLCDAFRELKTLLPPYLVKPRPQTIFQTALALLLIGICIVRTVAVQRVYQRQVPVDFYGANRLRLSAEDVAADSFLVKNIQTDCDVLFSMPGIYSLNFWAQKETPNGFNATAWMSLLSEKQQEAVIRNLENSPRACVVYNPPLAKGGLRGQNLTDFPLARYILENFTTKVQTGEYRLMIRRAAMKNQ